MERVLALQTLDLFADSDPVEAGCSGTSNGCSSSSTDPPGKSGCSIGCGEAEEMEW